MNYVNHKPCTLFNVKYLKAFKGLKYLKAFEGLKYLKALFIFWMTNCIEWNVNNPKYVCYLYAFQFVLFLSFNIFMTIIYAVFEYYCIVYTRYILL